MTLWDSVKNKLGYLVRTGVQSVMGAKKQIEEPLLEIDTAEGSTDTASPSREQGLKLYTSRPKSIKKGTTVKAGQKWLCNY